jgi:hypothetical protein
MTDIKAIKRFLHLASIDHQLDPERQFYRLFLIGDEIIKGGMDGELKSLMKGFIQYTANVVEIYICKPKYKHIPVNEILLRIEESNQLDMIAYEEKDVDVNIAMDTPEKSYKYLHCFRNILCRIEKFLEDNEEATSPDIYAYISKSYPQALCKTNTTLDNRVYQLCGCMIPFAIGHDDIRLKDALQRIKKYVLEEMKPALLNCIKEFPPPVSPNAGLIYQKLKSLKKPNHAMKTDDLLFWLGKEHGKHIDEGVLRRHLKELEPYGITNKKRIGYYIKK